MPVNQLIINGHSNIPGIQALIHIICPDGPETCVKTIQNNLTNLFLEISELQKRKRN